MSSVLDDDPIIRPLTKNGSGVEWTQDDRERAYLAWRQSGSADRASIATGIPATTIGSWITRDRWVKRRQEDDARTQQQKLQRGLMLIVDDVPALVRALLDIAHMEGEDKIAHTRLLAIKHALGIAGLAPVDTKTVQLAALSADWGGGPLALSDDERTVVKALLGDED
jgi:hypothetical protein